MKDHAALVLIKNGETLFVQRSLKKKSLPGLWAFASGTCQDNEPPKQTAIREAQEELDVEVRPLAVMAVHELPSLEARLHFVICQLSSGEPTIKAPDEIEQLKWMTFEDFFSTFDNSQIGHGLIWLRANPKVWRLHGL